MTHSSAQALFDELDDLLDKEREALLLGDLETIAALLSLKENLMDRIREIVGGRSGSLRELQKKVERNQLLLDGALRGIRQASMRLAAIRHIRRNLETYSEDGLKQIIEGEVIRKVEKRA